jgi:hypothetical protein
MSPVFAPLYHLKGNAFWPTLVARQTIPPAWAACAATQPSHVGLGLVKAACRLLTTERVLGLAWQPDRAEWHLSYRGDSAAVALRGTRSTWTIAHAKSYHLGLAALTDGLLLGAINPAAAEFRERWGQLVARLTELAGPPPYLDWRLAQCAQDQMATNLMMAATDACYFYAKARATADGLEVIEQMLSAEENAAERQGIMRIWSPDPPADPSPAPPVRPRRRLFSLDDLL